MKKDLFSVLLIFFVTTAINFVSAQSNEAVADLTLDVSEVSLIKVSTGVVSLQLKQRDAGLSLESQTSDSTTRLLISSVVSEQPRTLSARISDGVIPPGTQIQISALPPNVNFVGTAGLFSNPIVLNETDNTFVTQIRTCYSGTDLSDGYPLKFSFSLDTNPTTYGSIRATTSNSISVTITLTEAN